MQTRSKSGVLKPKVFTATQISQITHLEPNTTQEALTNHVWKNAMKEEIKALKFNHTWSLVPYKPNMNVLGTKWVYRTKYNPNGTIAKHKAYLVAKGFHQNPGIDFYETYSPIVKASTIRIMFSIAVSHDWDIQQVDINNAFVNGELQETVYVQQPEGFLDERFPNHVCRLKKALYGLKQAPRAWFNKLKNSLREWGFCNSVSDSSLFYQKKGKDLTLILIYVDDILITGSNKDRVQGIIQKLGTSFALKTLGSLSYFLGFEAHRNEQGLHLCQAKYIKDLLERVRMGNCKPVRSPAAVNAKLTKSGGDLFENPTQYRSVIGALQYLTNTRPDISYIVNKLSQFMSNPLTSHWIACKRILRYLKGTIYLGLTFRPSTNPLKLEGFSDSDWAGSLDDRKSTSGHCVFLRGNLISWSSKKQSVVAHSSTEAEYRSLSQIATEILWVTSLLNEIGLPVPSKPTLWCNNTSAQALALNTVFHSMTKHIEIDVHFIRELVEKQKLIVNHISTNDQKADSLTKSLSVDRFEQGRNKLNLCLHPMFSLTGGVKEDTVDISAKHNPMDLSIKPTTKAIITSPSNESSSISN